MGRVLGVLLEVSESRKLLEPSERGQFPDSSVGTRGRDRVVSKEGAWELGTLWAGDCGPEVCRMPGRGVP